MNLGGFVILERGGGLKKEIILSMREMVAFCQSVGGNNYLKNEETCF